MVMSQQMTLKQHIINLLDQVMNLIGDSNKTWAVEAKKHIDEMVRNIVSDSTARPENIERRRS